MTNNQTATDADRFDALWRAFAGRVLAYATRQVGADDAQELVADTFLVVWRRLSDVPLDPLPWLLVIARNTAANRRRSLHRRAALYSELTRLEQAAAPAAGADVTVAERALALTRLAALSEKEREALLLITWDGLQPAAAAQVADCSVAAFHVRLHRARRKLQQPLPEDPPRPLDTHQPTSSRASPDATATANNSILHTRRRDHEQH